MVLSNFKFLNFCIISILRSFLLGISCAYVGALISCNEDVKEPEERCYELSGLALWTINDRPQEPGDNFEPNIGGNLSLMYDLSLDGSFGVSIDNDTFAISWGEPWELLFTGKELAKFSEEQWESEMAIRGKYDVGFQEDTNFRRQLWVTYPDGSLKILGDEPEEFLEGKIDYYLAKLDGCKFVVLDLSAVFLHETDTFRLHLIVDEPYLYH